ncbi:hypothetical protein EV356DRAFT_234164 [Viridothelium virens]|uniref:Secreted protein n=1 Tax=Viridothelium virens TaxID=1048519 RepID=A0A6A6H561_VIRVR|nr:hypothetical protein EV356DRAFT_234164 [Viridothelium virens]
MSLVALQGGFVLCINALFICMPLDNCGLVASHCEMETTLRPIRRDTNNFLIANPFFSPSSLAVGFSFEKDTCHDVKHSVLVEKVKWLDSWEK